MNKDSKDCLLPLEIKLAELLMPIETRGGKRLHGVVILVTAEMIILMQFRWVGNIDGHNQYAFHMEFKTCERGSDALRYVVFFPSKS